MKIGHALRAIIVLIILLCLPLTSLAQSATPATVQGLQEAVDWLISQQAEDGSFTGFSGESDPGTTADAVWALAAASNAGVDVDAPLAKARDFLLAESDAYAALGPGPAAKLILALIAAGVDRPSLDDAGLTSIVQTSGLDATAVIDHALVILALVALDESVPSGATEALRTVQSSDGSWDIYGSSMPGMGDSNTTALVVQALAAAGVVDDPAIVAAFAFLAQMRTAEGGFSFFAFDPVGADANSTAVVLQAAIAAGQDLGAPEWQAANQALRQFQNPNGAFHYTAAQPEDNLFATIQAIPALAGVALPIGPVASIATPSA